MGLFDDFVKEVFRSDGPIKPYYPTTIPDQTKWLRDIVDHKANVPETNRRPAVGALVYCELGFGMAEHTGIYVGGDRIVELSGSGDIQLVSFRQFTGNLTTLDNTIYHPCDLDGMPLGHQAAAARAQRMVNQRRDYHLLLDNCHQFASGCVTGDFENNDNFLWMVKDTFANEMTRTVQWKAWSPEN